MARIQEDGSTVAASALRLNQSGAFPGREGVSLHRKLRPFLGVSVRRYPTKIFDAPRNILGRRLFSAPMGGPGKPLFKLSKPSKTRKGKMRAQPAPDGSCAVPAPADLDRRTNCRSWVHLSAGNSLCKKLRRCSYRKLPTAIKSGSPARKVLSVFDREKPFPMVVFQ